MKNLIVVLVVLFVASLASANLLQNASFETVDPGNGEMAEHWLRDAGWWSVRGDSTYMGNGVTPKDGSYDYWNRHGGQHRQIVDLATGLVETDVITFSAWWYVDINDNGVAAPLGRLALWTGDWDEIGESASISTLTQGSWQQLSFTVAIADLANKASIIGDTQIFARIECSDGSDARGDTLFDMAELTIVPEPATMILLGLGGLLLRRKKA